MLARRSRQSIPEGPCSACPGATSRKQLHVGRRGGVVRTTTATSRTRVNPHPHVVKAFSRATSSCRHSLAGTPLGEKFTNLWNELYRDLHRSVRRRFVRRLVLSDGFFVRLHLVVFEDAAD